jgi:hypothetical protein
MLILDILWAYAYNVFEHKEVLFYGKTETLQASRFHTREQLL